MRKFVKQVFDVLFPRATHTLRFSALKKKPKNTKKKEINCIAYANEIVGNQKKVVDYRS